MKLASRKLLCIPVHKGLRQAGNIRGKLPMNNRKRDSRDGYYPWGMREPQKQMNAARVRSRGQRRGPRGHANCPATWSVCRAVARSLRTTSAV